jgi:hypothetical protein
MTSFAIFSLDLMEPEQILTQQIQDEANSEKMGLFFWRR